MSTSIWLNKGFSSTYNVLSLIREGDIDRRFRLLCSHTSTEFIGFAAADDAYIEPTLKLDDDYLAWCLQFCREQKVKLFIPARRSSFIARHATLFEETGTRIAPVCPDELHQTIDNKGLCYDFCRGHGLPIPDYHIVTNLEQFDAAYDLLKERHPIVCFKPSVSVFGLGFKVLTEKGREIDRLLNGDVYKIGLELARRIFGDQPEFREIMVMQYLGGDERSVDCLADRGKLLRHVIRRKSGHPGGAQILEENKEISAISERLTTLFSLNGLYNIQFRESGGIPYLLEINPRMSGGIHYTSHSGLNLPYWGICYALGLCGESEIPSPVTGAKVGKADIGVLVS
ncbi:MAG: ATP-grasp domain-containing protein [Desulfuromonadaceae bacterium]